VRSTLRLAFLLLLAAPAAFAEPPDPGATRLLRYPTVSKDRIAFVYAGDIWTVPLEGGMAHRLTSDPGEELFPRFSPDGKWIAFTGHMSGTPQVWVIPADGGPARQLTFHNDVGRMPPRGGIDNQVMGWTPDG
jgi:tricorn protease